MRMKRWLVGALAGAVTVVGLGVAGIAMAANTPPGGGGAAAHATAFLNDVAQHLGVSPTKLEDAIRQANVDRVNQLRSSGKITATEAKSMISKIQSRSVSFWPGVGDHRFGGDRGMRPDLMSPAAKYLGITPQQLRNEVAGGNSLQELAQATSGKSVQGLETAVLSGARGDLAQRVSAGTMTSARQQAILARIQSQLPTLVTHSGAWADWHGHRPGKGEQPAISASHAS